MKPEIQMILTASVVYQVKNFVTKLVSSMGGGYPFLDSSYFGMLPVYSVSCILLFGFSPHYFMQLSSPETLRRKKKMSSHCVSCYQKSCNKISVIDGR